MKLEDSKKYLKVIGVIVMIMGILSKSGRNIIATFALTIFGCVLGLASLIAGNGLADRMAGVISVTIYVLAALAIRRIATEVKE